MKTQITYEVLSGVFSGTPSELEDIGTHIQAEIAKFQQTNRFYYVKLIGPTQLISLPNTNGSHYSLNHILWAVTLELTKGTRYGTDTDED